MMTNLKSWAFYTNSAETYDNYPMYAFKNEVNNLKCGVQIALQLSQNSYGQEFMHKLY